MKIANVISCKISLTANERRKTTTICIFRSIRAKRSKQKFAIVAHLQCALNLYVYVDYVESVTHTPRSLSHALAKSPMHCSHCIDASFVYTANCCVFLCLYYIALHFKTGSTYSHMSVAFANRSLATVFYGQCMHLRCTVWVHSCWTEPDTTVEPIRAVSTLDIIACREEEEKAQYRS